MTDSTPPPGDESTEVPSAVTDDPGVATVWRPGRPVPVGAILGVTRRGAGDPTYQVVDRVLWRGQQTPLGPAAVAVHVEARLGEVHARAWGPGAAYALEWFPRSLGADDDVAGFEPVGLVAELHRRHEHWRVPCTGLVYEALVAAAIEQKVTGQEAFGGFQAMVRRYGAPAPGPAGERGLMVMPAPSVLRQVPSWGWLGISVDAPRSRLAVRAAVRSDALHRTLDLDEDEADRALQSLPGLGVWTSAEVRHRSHGHADAVSFGDYHVARDITHALTGEVGDDDRMAELLEPYRPHRYRVQRLFELERVHRPRRGPRMAPRRHLPGSRR